MELLKAKYTSNDASIVVRIDKIHHQDNVKAKVRYTVMNKRNGIIYETRNATLMKDRIRHWRIHEIK